MRVEIISSGDEIVRGNSVDTNSAWLSKELQAIGLKAAFHTTVGDDLADLREAIGAACRRADIVLLTGGLGPTEDDLTRDAAAKVFGRPLEYRPALWKAVRKRYRARGIRMAKINRRQAYAPKGSTALANEAGVAPGIFIRDRGTLFFALPGVPREMRVMFEKEVKPKLPAKRAAKTLVIRTFGTPEATIDTKVSRIVRRAKGVEYGITAKEGTVTVTLRSKKSMRTLRDKIRRAVGKAWVGEGRVTLPEAVAALLRRRRATIAIAESYTGGMIAHRLTDVPGISASLLEAIVTYSNESKSARLGVREATLRRHGAVSPQVAREMALGVARTSGADVGLSTTGIAGPAGGTAKKPVGLGYIAVAYRGRCKVERHRFPGDRPHVKRRAADAALNLVRLTLTP